MTPSRRDPDDAYVLDVDGTLTVDDKRKPYADKPLAAAMARAAARARHHAKILISTARGMKTKGGDLRRIRAETAPTLEAWLARKGIGHDGLHLGKPYCGPNGFYVDDRALHPEEFLFRVAGPWGDAEIDVVDLDPAQDLAEAGARQERLKRLNRLFHVRTWLAAAPLEMRGAAPANLRDDPRVGFFKSPHEALDGDGAPWAFVLLNASWTIDPYRAVLRHLDSLQHGAAEPLVFRSAGLDGLHPGARQALLPRRAARALIEAGADPDRLLAAAIAARARVLVDAATAAGEAAPISNGGPLGPSAP